MRSTAKAAIETSKYLGGDEENTHKVKGLDFALLTKAKMKILKEEREAEEKKKEKEEHQQQEEATNNTQLVCTNWYINIHLIFSHHYILYLSYFHIFLNFLIVLIW